MELTDFFDNIWQQTRSLEEAQSLFSRSLIDDPQLKRQYRLWCADNDVSEKRGFADYCRLRLEQEESRWQTLCDDYNDI